MEQSSLALFESLLKVRRRCVRSCFFTLWTVKKKAWCSSLFFLRNQMPFFQYLLMFSRIQSQNSYLARYSGIHVSDRIGTGYLLTSLGVGRCQYLQSITPFRRIVFFSSFHALLHSTRFQKKMVGSFQSACNTVSKNQMMTEGMKNCTCFLFAAFDCFLDLVGFKNARLLARFSFFLTVEFQVVLWYLGWRANNNFRYSKNGIVYQAHLEETDCE